MALQQGTVTITGRVGTQPVQFGTDPQRMGCKFRLACTRAYRDRDGQWQNMPTIWITVKAFRALAQHIMYSVNRGEPVIVTGSLGAEEWTGEDNKLHTRIVVEASAVGHDLNYGITTIRKIEKPRDDNMRQPNWQAPAPYESAASPFNTTYGVPATTDAAGNVPAASESPFNGEYPASDTDHIPTAPTAPIGDAPMQADSQREFTDTGADTPSASPERADGSTDTAAGDFTSPDF